MEKFIALRDLKGNAHYINMRNIASFRQSANATCITLMNNKMDMHFDISIEDFIEIIKEIK